ncbi:regulator of chromosome condensation 1/beta-lactamase-inhibitor protein II [Coniella lustricola]|uniref:Regulator of chromosome condensation 1/beta-lactamase-inhibitor protein II n=1 Tax=Coniella lustricola TaxID=2025994 RepID=A0A2T3ABJ3_9PEZI|nr:regulator of chromosome condensation 1/beta-lactamase-inhibitor protein II [Coniella lustricola]
MYLWPWEPSSASWKAERTTLNSYNSTMELYASGFNAWGQLYFDGTVNEAENAPDLRQFVPVLKASTIDNVQAFLSYTTVRSASGAVKQFESFKDLLNNFPGRGFPELQTCRQVVAYDAGFAALTTTGAVYTWGDERYGACLGREITGDSPAEKPSRVKALEDLPTGPISKIAAGGYMLAALTSGNDLYLWGGHPGRKTVPTDIGDEPSPIVIEDHDIADVAVGDSHLAVLTTSGKVYVIGDNTNGQLGSPVKEFETWTPIDLGFLKCKRIAGIAAGPRNTFITVASGASSYG